MQKVILIGVVIGFSFITSCNRSVTVHDFLKNTSNDPDYKREFSYEDYTMTCTYRPSELICLSELVKGKADFVYNKNDFKNELNKYGNSLYFDLTISTKDHRSLLMEGVGNQSDYASRIAELTYLMAQKCFLVLDSKDTVKSTACNFSNTFGNDPDLKVLFLFPKKKIIESTKKVEMIYISNDFNLKEKAVFSYDISDLTKTISTIKE